MRLEKTMAKSRQQFSCVKNVAAFFGTSHIKKSTDAPKVTF